MRIIVALGVLAAVLLAGCERKSEVKKGPGVRIAVIPKGTSHVFWQSVHAGANRAARELGIDDPDWNGPSKESEVDRQINIIDDMLAAGADAFVLAPLDQRALAASVDKLARKNKPVVIFDSAIEGTSAYAAFVATDNYKGGQLAGRHMIELLGPEGGEVAVVKVAPESASTLARERGFADAIKANPRIVLIDAGFSDSDREKARAKAADALVSSPSIKAFFGPNESSAVGILVALKEKKLDGKLKFVGFDSSDELATALDQGKIDALVLQDPFTMGYKSVKAAYAALKGEAVQKDQPIEPTLVTRANSADSRIKAILRPDLTKDLVKR